METYLHQSIYYPYQSSYRTYEEWKLIIVITNCHVIKRSYRTYEEWKHITNKMTWLFFISSYRTYEEWKRIRMQRRGEHEIIRSYRTYEEWKLLSLLPFSM